MTKNGEINKLHNKRIVLFLTFLETIVESVCFLDTYQSFIAEVQLF